MSLFTRLKTWAKNETLKSDDLNAEFDNIISNMIPASIVSYEQTVNQMRIQTDPGSQGSESQASSEAGEFERLRFVINRALGGTYWYDNPNTSLTSIQTLLNTAVIIPQNRVQSGRVDANNQPMYITPDTGSNSTMKLKATATNLSAYIENSLVTVSSDISTSLSGPSSFTTLVNDASLIGQASSALQGENGTVFTIDTPTGTPPTAGTYQAFKIVHSGTTEYFFGRYLSSTQIDKCSRGNFFDHSDGAIKRTVVSDNDVITLCRAAYVFLTNVSGVAGVSVTYNEPIVSYSQPASPTSGDWWLDLSAGGIWKVFTSGTFIDGTGTFIGIAVVDGANCVAARAKFFDRGFSTLNTVTLELGDTATIRTASQGARISVYGNSFQYLATTISWGSSQLDSGVTIGNSTTYYLYLTDKGRPYISDQAPHNSLGSLLGYYHPSKPWRAVGYFTTDGSANFQTPINYDYLAIPPQFIDQTRLGTAPISTLSITTPTDATSATGVNQALTSSYVDLAAGFGATSTLILNNRPVLIKVGLVIVNADAGNRNVFLQVLKGATVIRTYKALLLNGAVTNCCIQDMFFDTGGVGSTVYKLQVKFTSGTTITAFPMGVSTPTAFGAGFWVAGIGDAYSTTTGLRALECIEL